MYPEPKAVYVPTVLRGSHDLGARIIPSCICGRTVVTRTTAGDTLATMAATGSGSSLA